MGIITFDSIDIRDDIADEVEDIRLAYNGVTFESAGDSVRGQAALLDSYAMKKIVIPSSDLISGKFINNAGNAVDSSLWSCTDYIDIYGCGDGVIVAHGQFYGGGGLAYYDENKSTLGYVNGNNASDYGATGSASQMRDVTINPPTGTAYIRLSGITANIGDDNFYVKVCRFSDNQKIKNLESIEGTVDELVGAVGEIDYYNLIDPNSLTYGTYINGSNGNKNTGSNQDLAATEFIELKPNTTYYASNLVMTGNYAFYDSDKNFVSNPDVTVSTGTTAYNGTIQTGQTAYYYRGTVIQTSTSTTLPFLSSYVSTYKPYGIVPIVDKIETEKCNRSKVLVIGDSISTDYYGNYKKWVTVLKEEGFLPATTTNSSVHATGFVARHESSENDFITRIEAIEDKSTYDMVIVFGGINDYIQSIPLGGGSGETDITVYFKPAVDYFFNYLMQNFTQARLCVLLPLRTYATWVNSVGEYQQAYIEYIHDVAKSYCLPVLNLTEESGFCPFIASFRDMWTLLPSGFETHDGVHPNEEYEHDFLAPMIKDFLRGM